jgi:lysozyme
MARSERLASVRTALLVALTSCLSLLSGCSTRPRESMPHESMPIPGVWLEVQTRAGRLPEGQEWRSMGPKGLALTKTSESFRGKPYNDPVGFCTVGYGHLIKKVPCDGSEPPEFVPEVSEPMATKLLMQDLRIAEHPVLTEVSRDISLTQTQFDALCDFVFNVGAQNFRQSQLLVVINDREFHRVPGQLRRWVFADGKKLRGLVTRREREIELFMEGVTITRGPVPADKDLSPIDIRTGESPTR